MDGSRRWPVISALGIVQILSWGSSFYLLGVLATPIAADTGWPLTWIVGGLSAGLLVAGLVSPTVGRTIARHGGRPVLASAAVAMATGLVVLALAPNLTVFLLAWLFLGLGMGMGLYDPAFATLGRLYGAQARPAIATLTLWGGFASTVSWPLSALLVEAIGWRGTCLAYAGLQLAVSLPLVLWTIPPPATPAPGPDVRQKPVPVLAERERRAFVVMAGILVLGGTVMTMVSVHLLTLLQARAVPLASAVAFGALIGPAQVGARLMEMAGRGRHHPLWTLTAAMSLVAVGIALLAVEVPFVGLALVLYGAGNGIYSIARGTVPLVLFGPERYAPLIGLLARPGLMAQAAAPLVGAFVLTHGGAEGVFVLLTTLAVANVALVGLLWRCR
ncbi:MFS transporter [Methylobacterium sp. Leaf466]|uniref:MFS transporter n=1 Tax=Methylobacterium sp. Leaf466 TaxID=1736386 RepID=UPI0006F1D501|nr:MFS transporter [Methylobacterium sp. Leaf466]KQT78871.1 MFS transporter [Methylobacterium sp. Leaf466]